MEAKYRRTLWKLVAPLSPFFLASMLNASCTNTYAVDISCLSCLLEDNALEEGDRVMDSNSGPVNHATGTGPGRRTIQ
jgi:hypothetical protein